MAKFIGTGLDPRAPEGVDFDVPDARADEIQTVEESGIGDPVEPGTEAEAVHAGLEIIAEEGGPPEVVEGSDLSGQGRADRVAARVESTSAHETGSGGSEGFGGEGLSGLTREELNERASAAGVEDPESLPNKEAVADAIRAAEGGGGSEK